MRVQRTATQSKQPDNLARWLEEHSRALSGNISFGQTMSNKDTGQNMSAWKATGTTPAANTEFAIPHQLNYVPLTILGADTNNGGVLYRGTTPWTAKAIGTPNPAVPSELPVGHIYLKCTTGGAAYNVIFG